MASAQAVETSVTNNSPSQDSHHPDDPFQSRWVYYVSKLMENAAYYFHRETITTASKESFEKIWFLTHNVIKVYFLFHFIIRQVMPA